MDRRERIRNQTASVWKEAKYAGVGIEFGISIAACYFAGAWAQDRWDFAPWGMLGGVLIGFASGLRSLMKIAQAESRRPSSHQQTLIGDESLDRDEVSGLADPQMDLSSQQEGGDDDR